MSAKEMFEELGYVAFENYNRITYELSEDENIKTIEFINNGLNEVLFCEDAYEVFHFTMEELKAINKQIEELGWNNE